MVPVGRGVPIGCSRPLRKIHPGPIPTLSQQAHCTALAHTHSFSSRHLSACAVLQAVPRPVLVQLGEPACLFVLPRRHGREPHSRLLQPKSETVNVVTGDLNGTEWTAVPKGPCISAP